MNADSEFEVVIDPVVEHLHKQREEYMKRFGYDLDAIIRDIKAREAANPGPLLKPRKLGGLP